MTLNKTETQLCLHFLLHFTWDIDMTLFVYKIYYTLNSVQSFCKYKIQIFFLNDE